MDSENDGGDVRVIDELTRDRSGQDTWWRYHLISDVLRHEAIDLVHRDLTGIISARIKNEPAILAPHSFSRRNWIKPVAGFAIAASVAVVAILGIQQKGEDIVSHPQVTGTVAGLPTAAAVAGKSSTAPESRQFKVPARLASVETLEEIIIPQPANSRMNSYLLNYNEYRTTETRMQGMLPYVRIIAHENDN